MAAPFTVQIGSDVLLLSSFSGEEALSHLFHFQLDMYTENERDIHLDALVGRPASFNVVMADGSVRYFNGIVSRIGQGARGKTYTSYHADVVPSFWLLTRTQRSRIFQSKSVPDILRQVLGSAANAELRLVGNYEARDYCVQYRETDFNFASRLMEEEGIFYFFKHSQGGHTLVIGDSPAAYGDVPGSRVIAFDPTGASKDAGQAIFEWEKSQELRSGKVTLWDHEFELPDDHLEGTAIIRESVQVGQVTHTMRVAGNDKFEIYDYPGAYAERFDGIDKGGGEQPGELQKLFPEAARTAASRMDEEALPSIKISGSSNSRQLAAGHRFTISGHFNADGPYVLTTVQHRARVTDPLAGRGMQYENDFTCIPESLTYRPARTTPTPSVPGTDTAVIVGPASDEIFQDKYGRVKVQFHWDREGKKDENSSCWIRVVQPWSGKPSGVVWVPTIGDEVVVAFEHGDPDRPYIIGSVFNPRRMPPPPPAPQ